MAFRTAACAILAALGLAMPAAAQFEGPVASEPPPLPTPVALSEQVIVECRITPEFTTADCTTASGLDYTEETQSVLESLARRPLHLVSAPIGQRIEIAVLRSERARTSTIGKGRRANYRPRMITNMAAMNLRSFYPPVSVRLNEEGDTFVVCKVTDEGLLNECWIVPEPSADLPRLRRAHLLFTKYIRMPVPTDASPPYDQRIYLSRLQWRLH